MLGECLGNAAVAIMIQLPFDCECLATDSESRCGFFPARCNITLALISFFPFYSTFTYRTLDDTLRNICTIFNQPRLSLLRSPAPAGSDIALVAYASSIVGSQAAYTTLDAPCIPGRGVTGPARQSCNGDFLVYLPFPPLTFAGFYTPRTIGPAPRWAESASTSHSPACEPPLRHHRRFPLRALNTCDSGTESAQMVRHRFISGGRGCSRTADARNASGFPIPPALSRTAYPLIAFSVLSTTANPHPRRPRQHGRRH